VLRKSFTQDDHHPPPSSSAGTASGARVSKW